MEGPSIHVAALMAVALCTAAPAASQPYPSKAVRIVVPSVPGGGTDIAARALAPHLGQVLETQVLVDNRPSPSGNVAAAAVAKASPDGYTLLLTSNVLAISPGITPKLTYDAVKDFVPIGAVMSSPFVLLVPPSVQVKSVKDLIALAKAQPDKLLYGHPGDGSAERLCGELFAKAAGVRVVGATFKDPAQPAGASLAAGVHYAFAGVAHALPHVKAGQARALAVTTPQRYPLLPGVPAISETLAGFEFPAWQAMFAPARTPPAVLRRIEAAVAKAIDSKEVHERLAVHGLQPVPATGDELRTFLPRQISRWDALVREANVRVE